YGYMDFFSWQNMHDVRLAASVKPVKGLTVTADYHLFWLANTADFFYGVSGAPRRTGGYGLKPGNDKLVGTGPGVGGSYQLKNFANAQLGYGHFFIGDYVERSLVATGSKDADWLYAQIIFNF